MDAKANTADGDRLDVLVTLAEAWEEKHHAIDAPDPIEAIRLRWINAGLTRRDLESYIGSRARVAEVLNHKRSLTLPMIRKLHSGLGIPAEVLIRDRSSLPDAYTADLYCFRAEPPTRPSPNCTSRTTSANSPSPSPSRRPRLDMIHMQHHPPPPSPATARTPPPKPIALQHFIPQPIARLPRHPPLQSHPRPNLHLPRLPPLASSSPVHSPKRQTSPAHSANFQTAVHNTNC